MDIEQSYVLLKKHLNRKRTAFNSRMLIWSLFSEKDHGPEVSHPRLDHPPQPSKEASEYKVKEEKEKGVRERGGREDPELAQN